MSRKIFVIMTIASILNFFGCKKESEKSKDIIEMEEMLDEWHNRNIYKSLTPEIIATIPDDNLEQIIFDNIYEIIKDDHQIKLSDVKKLKKGQQAFWSTWILEGEVNNGGFNQFYFNSSGQYAEMAVIGFDEIGAEQFSNLVSRANEIYVENKERLENFDDGTLESFSESYKDNPLNDLDTKFYDLYDSENLTELRIKYIRENINEFTTN